MIGLGTLTAADDELGAIAAARLRAIVEQRTLQARASRSSRRRSPRQSLTRRRDAEAAQEELLQRLLQAAGYRDDNTHEHTQRVGALAARLARGLGLPDRQVALIHRDRAAARHRQDRDPGLDPAQARQADRGGVRGRQDARRAGRARAGRRQLRPAADGRDDRPPPPRALGRRRLPRRPGGRGDPDRGPARAPRRRLRRAPARAPVQGVAGRSRRPSRRSRAAPARTSTRRPCGSSGSSELPNCRSESTCR